MKVVAIIQARMGSSRLPGKVLADIGGRSMLSRVCHRARLATLVDRVVVATTWEPEDEAVVTACQPMGVACFRGNAEDVLDRYHEAARAFRADLVVRITSDCPLIDPPVIDLVVSALAKRGGHGLSAGRRAGPFRYASNTLRRTWPRGLDTEVMTAAALGRACREATEPYERTHVTPYLYRHPESCELIAVTGPEDLGAMRWTVDLPEDLRFVRAVYERLDGDGTFSWQDVRRLLARQPSLVELNRHVRQRQLVEG